jgi:energy-coupling factor transporter ATP-binding protein EcfA2
VERADCSTVRLKRIEAGRDIAVSTTTLQLFVGTSSRDDQTISVTPDGGVLIGRAGAELAAPPAAANPYKGIEAFNAADAERFFGREAAIELLWQRCRQFVASPLDEAPLRLLPVVGPSGCGKSSLVRAGLLPELIRRPLPGLGSPRIAELVPGSHPVDTLAAVLARIETGDPLPAAKQREFAELIAERDGDGAYHGLRRIVRFLTGEGRALIVYVDQFEEVWSLCDSPDERDAFIAGLLDIASDRDARASVVFTLRSDFLGSASAHPVLSQAISRRAFLVPAMVEAELGRAIAEPARRAGFVFDDPTVNLMIADTWGREGALPSLQFTLTRIWEGLKANVPAAETLRQLGGVGGALAKEAERLYAQLPEADRRIVRRAFLAQVRLGEGIRDSRRRAALGEIVAMGEKEEHVLGVLRVFSQPGERLITLGSDPGSGAVTAELTHEALLEHWASLRDWIAESREDLRFQRRIEDAASDWQAQGQPAGLLWRSPQLEQLRAFRQRRAADMTLTQVDFLRASERQRKRERWRRYVTAATVLLLVLTVAVINFRHGYIAWTETRPWGRLINLSSGKSYPLRYDTANVGRPAEGAEDVKHQVELYPRAISRIHIGISNTGNVIDWRSPYGTTHNGEWLPYANAQKLDGGDILVLSGLEVFRYQPIEWHPWDYAREFLHRREFPDETGLEAWAAVLDRKELLPVRRDQQFVNLRADRVELTDAKTEDSVLVVRRHIFHDRVTISPRDMQTFKLDGERDQPYPYLAYVIVPDKTWCPIKRDHTVLTLQRLPGSEKRMTSRIKEGDYVLRQIELPLGLEVVSVEEGGRAHGLGEILFRTKVGPLQVVPLQTDSAELCQG